MRGKPSYAFDHWEYVVTEAMNSRQTLMRCIFNFIPHHTECSIATTKNCTVGNRKPPWSFLGVVATTDYFKQMCCCKEDGWCKEGGWCKDGDWSKDGGWSRDPTIMTQNTNDSIKHVVVEEDLNENHIVHKALWWLRSWLAHTYQAWEPLGRQDAISAPPRLIGAQTFFSLIPWHLSH